MIETLLSSDNLNRFRFSTKKRLREEGLTSHCTIRKQYLRPQNVHKTLLRANEELNWSDSDWKKVLWSDECPYTVFGQNTRSHVRRRPREALRPHCVGAAVKHEGGKVIVWVASVPEEW